jgi:hypothetical protein
MKNKFLLVLIIGVIMAVGMVAVSCGALCSGGCNYFGCEEEGCPGGNKCECE